MGILGNLNSFVLGSVIRPKRNHQQSPYPLGVCNQMRETRVQKRTSSQVGCMRQALGPGALGRPRGSGWRGRWEGGSGWRTHVNPWLFHFTV